MPDANNTTDSTGEAITDAESKAPTREDDALDPAAPNQVTPTANDASVLAELDAASEASTQGRATPPIPIAPPPPPGLAGAADDAYGAGDPHGYDPDEPSSGAAPASATERAEQPNLDNPSPRPVIAHPS